MVEILNMISLISFILFGVFLVLSVTFFLKFNIIKIVGDLSGKTAKKSIAQMREKNEKYNKKSFMPSGINYKIKAPEKKEKKEENSFVETSILNEDLGATELIEGGDTEIIEDTVTNQEIEETASLNDSSNVVEEKKKGIQLVMLDEVILTHTDEVI